MSEPLAGLSPGRRLLAALLGYVYGFAYGTRRRRLLGIRLSTLIVLASLAWLVWAWRWSASGSMVYAAGAWLVGLAVVYLLSARAGYFSFYAGQARAMPQGALQPLPPDRPLDLLATGLFSGALDDEAVLLAPAQYWRVPLGDHIVMVQERPGRFLYQFFDGGTLQAARSGWLVHGLRPRRALAVDFMQTSMPQTNTWDLLRSEANDGQKPARRRTVYLSFPDKQSHDRAWHTIVDAARQARGGESAAPER